MSPEPILPSFYIVLFAIPAIIWIGLIAWGVVSVLKNQALITTQRIVWIVMIILLPVLGPFARFLTTPRQNSPVPR